MWVAVFFNPTCSSQIDTSAFHFKMVDMVVFGGFPADSAGFAFHHPSHTPVAAGSLSWRRALPA
jgi:hypothetical protein